MSHGNEPLGGVERKSGNTSPEETAARVTDKIAKRGLHHVEKHNHRLETLKVEYVDIKSIKPNTYNPNRQDEETLELLKKSMQEDGFTQPIVARRTTREIVDGEHRWRAAQALGMTQVPVAFVDMTDEQMRIATLRHNRARGSEDIDLSTALLRDLQRLGAIEHAQDSLMISDDEMNELLAADAIDATSLAGDDYSESWIPDRGDKSQSAMAEDERGSTKILEKREEGKIGIQAMAMTKAAAASVLERQNAIKSATDEASLAKIRAGADRPFRLNFTFTDDEAKLVRKVLGDEPAQRLLDICNEIDEAD